jgi:hypothetical protein
MAIATAEETSPAAWDDPGLVRAVAEGEPGALPALYDRYAPDAEAGRCEGEPAKPVE